MLQSLVIIIIILFNLGPMIFFLIFNKIGLQEHLSPNRRNGLFSMVEKIKSYAREMIE